MKLNFYMQETEKTWEIKEETVEAVRGYLSSLYDNDDFQRKARSVVQKKLGNMLYARGEVEEIAADAVQQVIANLLNALYEKTSKRFSENRLRGKEIKLSDVQRYIMAGVKNYCNTRAERWSMDKSAPRTGKDHKQAESTVPDNSNTEHKPTSGLEHIAVRARQPILSKNPYGTDFWDEHVRTEFDHGEYDSENVAKILIERGLSEEQVDLINNKLSGTSFADMAREQGGTSDKYRKAFQRALDKANFEL